MATRPPIVLATRNPGKIGEFEELFRGVALELKSLRDFGPIPPVVEDGATFEDNAVKKARFTAKSLGLPALADDSGLRVSALGGAPGVRSARYAGEGATDGENNRALLKALTGINDRAAEFACVIAVAVPAGPALIYKGVCRGTILYEPRGEGGFGYDPVFYYPPSGKTFAEMAPEEKNRVSHRGRAMAELGAELDKVSRWLNQRLDEQRS